METVLGCVRKPCIEMKRLEINGTYNDTGFGLQFINGDTGGAYDDWNTTVQVLRMRTKPADVMRWDVNSWDEAYWN